MTRLCAHSAQSTRTKRQPGPRSTRRENVKTCNVQRLHEGALDKAERLRVDLARKHRMVTSVGFGNHCRDINCLARFRFRRVAGRAGRKQPYLTLLQRDLPSIDELLGRSHPAIGVHGTADDHPDVGIQAVTSSGRSSAASRPRWRSPIGDDGRDLFGRSVFAGGCDENPHGTSRMGFHGGARRHVTDRAEVPIVGWPTGRRRVADHPPGLCARCRRST